MGFLECVKPVFFLFLRRLRKIWVVFSVSAVNYCVREPDGPIEIFRWAARRWMQVILPRPWGHPTYRYLRVKSHFSRSSTVFDMSQTANQKMGGQDVHSCRWFPGFRKNIRVQWITKNFHTEICNVMVMIYFSQSNAKFFSVSYYFRNLQCFDWVRLK